MLNSFLSDAYETKLSTRQHVVPYVDSGIKVAVHFSSNKSVTYTIQQVTQQMHVMNVYRELGSIRVEPTSLVEILHHH